ncbi:TPR-like protein [Pochonia chlamydosporia 170]|uniref:TPR-like protein n=1 Tax=Pochonia chlamydosporia 170 TaxID=1380566 RepID=A0A219APS7_METCM|nr:TPR-like protein [Pochonia chlamydosporia 170]OWT42552.1 TPR-like protein [Pochonia chlamydosporia 170]
MKRPVSGNPDLVEGELDGLNLAGDETTPSRRGSKKICSPPASVTQQRGSRGSSPPTPVRSRARPSERDDGFVRGSKNVSGRQLWTADDDRKGAAPQRPRTPQTRRGPLAASGSHRRSPQHRTHPKFSQHHAHVQSPSENEVSSELFRQPHTRPISSDQLAAEVQGIYAGLVLLENKCIEYDNSQIHAELSEEQYHALISLHRSLLHEHHDFLLASQHPSASDALRRLASDHKMPVRMWHHGIHSFLELLRRKLSKSREHMLTFIYIAYTMIALLYETVPAFEDTWVECLGDLGRYRMAVEDDDIRDREIWTGVSKYWYTKASDKAPTTGRLYHHLAILARPNALQQLYFYAKSLCVPIPFLKARESMMTLFHPLLTPSPNAVQRLDPVDAAFVRVHGIIFSGKHEDQLEPSMKQFLDLLDSRIGREHGNWLESGYYIGISLSCLLLGFGDESNVLMRAILNPHRKHSDMDDNCEANTKSCANFKTSVEFAARTFKIVIARCGDKNILPCLHTLLVFYWFMMDFDAGQQYLEDSLPWEETAQLLNHLLRTSKVAPRLDTDEIPWPEGGFAHPLPEDYAMRGLIYTKNYYPNKWFDNTEIEDDEKYFEPASTVVNRCERILWLGYSIALKKKGKLVWDEHAKQFSTKSNDIDARQNEPGTPKQGPSKTIGASGVED